MKIEVYGVEFAYDGSDVLKGLGFGLERGEFVAVVGPNGSGKSTLLRCMDGILRPKKGCVLIDGDIVSRMESGDIAKQVAYVPQNGTRNFPATVFDTVLIGRRPHSDWSPGKDDLEKTAQVISQLGLDDVSMHDINHLSGGQRQKVFIGRALVQEPEVLLLDEPTANLDLRHQLEVLGIIKEQTRKGVCAVIAIHDLNLAVKFCDKVIMLDGGRIFAAGGREVLTSRNIEKVYRVKARVIKDLGQVFVIAESPAGEGDG